ncbi:uncharacterized protein [Nicotiana tomentosiformis]|uniref:uncharacterized protein n=1 Tax=Nicotiana tomentosiformis TaxID=4098 RepID=UPI00388C806A
MRLERFMRLRTPSFSGAESEDAQVFLDKWERMCQTTGIVETSRVSFTTFQFTGAAFRWWEAYERRRTVDVALFIWQDFSVLFLEKFVPQSRREELHRQFEQLRQDVMSVTQYEIKFSELARHAALLVPTDRERIRRFIDGLTYQMQLLMTRDRVSGATFDEVVHIARQIEMVCIQERVEREAKRPRGLGGFSGVLSGGQFHHYRGNPYRHAQAARLVHRGASSGHGSYSTHQGPSSLSSRPA